MTTTDPRSTEPDAVAALREALLEVRDAVRAGDPGLDPAPPPSLARLVEAFDRLVVEPQALELALGGVAPPQSIEARSFGIPGLFDVEADEDGWSVNTPVGTVRSDDGGISVETPQGNATFDGSSGRVETSFGSVEVDRGGVRVTTPAGSTRIGSDGRVTITDGDGRPVDVPLPGLPGGNGGIQGVPFEIPISFPTFKVQPFEIPISLPKFELEPLRIPVSPPQLGWPATGLPPWLGWLAGFPDVLLTPSPAGPVPIPYPRLGSGPTGLGAGAAALPGAVAGALATAVQSVLAIHAALGQMLEQGRGAPSSIAGLETPAPWVPQIGHAVGRAVARWMPGVHIAEAKIIAVSIVIPPGGWRSDVGFRTALEAELVVAGVPDDWARPVGVVLGGAFERWFSSGMAAGLPLYPAFAAFPAPQAPPMPGLPFPLLALCASPELEGLQPPALQAALLSELSGVAPEDTIEAAARQLARWFSERFLAWSASVQVVSLLGTGPVPSFAPPSVPAGPVVGGKVLPTRGILVGGAPFDAPMPWGT